MADWRLIEEGLKRGYSLDEVTDIIAKEEGVDPSYARERGFDSPAILRRLGYVKPETSYVKPETSDVARGFVTSFKQLPQLGYGLLAGAGAVAESVAGEGGVSTSMKNFGVKKYQEAGADIEKDSKQSDSLSYSWEQAKQGDFGSLVDWLQYGIGYGGGQAVQALATAGVGSLVGKTVLKGTAENLASKMVAKEALRLGATEEAKRLTAQEISKIAVANVASNIGQTVAIGSQAFGMEGGEIFGDLAQKTVKEGRAATGGELAKAFGATAAAGALEFVGDKLGVDVMLGKSKMFKPASSMTGVGGRAARAAVAVPGTVLAEGGTEYLQTGIEEYGKGNEKNFLPFMQSESAQKQALDAAGLGAVGGGGMAMVGGAFSSPQKKDAAPSPSPSISSAQTADDAIAAFQDEVASVTPRGSFSGMDDLAGLIESERSDLGKRRGLLAQQQQEARDMEAEFSGLVKDEQIDQSYRLNDAQKQRDAERTREGSYDLALQQREEQQGRTVEQLSAASEAQGFGDAEPTAMQLAMQRAQQKALDNEFSGLLKQERASLNEMRANVKRVAGVPVEQISTPQLEEIAQSEAHPNTKMAAVAALNDRHDAIQQERERLMQLREARLAEQSQGETNGVQPHAANGQVAARGPVGGSNHVPGGGLDAAVGNVAGSGRINANPPHVAQGSRESVSVPNADSQANVRALTENAAKRQATQLTNQGFPTVAYPHPTQPGMWAIGSHAEAKSAPAKEQQAQQAQHAPVEPAADDVPVINVRQQTPRKKPASNTIAQAIINLGGISTSLKTDILGDASIKTRPGLFTTNGTGDLGEIAAMLSSGFGFSQIDLNDPTDNSGAKQLADLIARSVNGETILNEEGMILAQQAEEEAMHREDINNKAREFGIKPSGKGRPFSKVEAEVLKLVEMRLEKEIYRAGEEMQAAREFALKYFTQEEVDAICDKAVDQLGSDASILEIYQGITKAIYEAINENKGRNRDRAANSEAEGIDRESRRSGLPEAEDRRPAGEGEGAAREGQGAEVTPEFGLIGQTEEEAIAEEQARRDEDQRKADEDRAEKRRIDAEAVARRNEQNANTVASDNFQLGQSSQEVRRMVHSGMVDMFGNNAEPAAKPADPITAVKATLDAAGVTGTDRTSTIAAVRRGDLTPAEGPSGETSSMFTPDGRATVAAEANRPAELSKGDRFKDAAGNEWEVWASRHGSVEAHPVINGKPQVNRDTSTMFAVDDGAKERHPDRRQDVFPVGHASDPIAAVKATLDAAGVTGTDRTSTIAAVRRGDLTPEDVAEAHPSPNVADSASEGKPIRPYATPDERNEAIWTLQAEAKSSGLEYSNESIKDAAEFGAPANEIAAAIDAGEDAVADLAERYAKRSNGLRQGFGQGNNDNALRENMKPPSEHEKRIASLTGRGLYELTEAQRSSLLKFAKVRSIDAFEEIAFSARREIIGRWLDMNPAVDKRSSDVAMFNAKSGSIGNPIDTATLESTIASVIAASPSQWSRDTVVTATLFADLPAPILAKAKAEGYDAHGRKSNGEKLTGVAYDGKVYLVQENISSEIEAEETLLHERIHQILHGNAEDENGKALRQSLGRLYSRIGGKDAIVALAKRIGADMSGPLAALPKVAVRNRPAFLVDEFLAHVEGQRAYEKFPQSVVRAIREFYGEFRDWLRSSKFVKIADAVGVNIGTFTQSDLSWTLKKIRQQQAGTGSKAIRFMTAWHGSPHDHDGFDSSKIGTGEGAQAYGWGHYFAEAREVAEWYRNTLSKPKTKATIDGKDFEDIDWLRNSGIEERWFNNWVAHPIASGIEDDMMVGDRINRLAERADQDGNTTKAKAVRKLLKMFNDGKIEAKIEKGRLYQVELAPDENQYLDWDKPFDEQSPRVQSAIVNDLGVSPDFAAIDGGNTGKDIYRALAEEHGGDRAASELLLLNGVRGIRYLDGSSRSAGDGNSNYVIFDDADVKITAKESRRASNDLDFTQPQGSEPLRKTSFGYANDTHNLFHVSTFKGNDGDVSTFDVYDTNTGEQLGFVSLGLRDGQITTLVAIEAEQKNVGFGEQLLRSLVARNPDGIYIINMLPEAVPFWQKMGVSLDEHFEGVWKHGNGVLTEEAIHAARNSERGIAAEDPGGRQKESRGNAESESGRQADNPLSSEGVANKTAPANAGVSVSAPSESVRRIQAVVERFKSQFKGASALDIRVVSTTFDIPARFRPSPFAEGVFHDDAGLVYLVTMNLHNPRGELSENRAWQVLLHESVGHYGLSQMMGDKFASILKAVKQATHTKGRVTDDSSDTFKPGDKDYATWDAVKLRYPKASDAEIAQEVLARMAETDPGSSIVGYAVAVVRQWVREMARAMGINLAVSTSELRDLVAKASGYMRRGDNLAEERVPSGLVAASTGVAREGGKRGLESRAATGKPQGPIWSAPEMSRTDNIIYTMQDKNIDLKRVQQAIKEVVGEIRDDIDTYLQEELFHGRAAKITEEFLDKEVNPLISLMRASNVSMEELETFLWARHAKERNAQIAKINEAMPDGGSGLTNKQADDIMAGKDVKIGDKTIAGVKPARKKLLSDLAGRVDAITRGNRALLERYSLESADTLNAWDGAYKHYVPLHREDAESHLAGMGTGQGYSVKGSSSKRATGSSRPVENILANLALQRERIITRGEKNRVAQSLYGLAKEMPNADLWEVDVKPTMRTTAMIGGREQVVDAIDPAFRSKPNVVFARFNGEDRFVVFNEHNERALRMAEALKNLDADDISHLLGEVSRWTRYFASINTQYNPIFGVTNLVRDVQTGLLNLKSTPIAGKQKEMMGHLVQALPAVFKALRAGRKGQAATGTWAQLWEEFQEIGGQTGYRNMFRNSQERAEALQNALDPTWWQKTWWGKAATVGGVLAVPEQAFLDKFGKPFMELLSDYNTMMENGIRLSAYKVALDSGMTKERAASLAKNLTVNFNRKGQAARQVGSLYAFFNASVQGTARMAETLNHGAKPGELLGKAGKQIVYGGLLLGAVQAMLLMAAGFDDEEPPEFVRDRNIIIPTGNGKYVSIPMPLGFHVLPAISRISIEFTAGGFKKPGEHLVHIMDVLLDSFNPIGNAGLSMQTVAPTVLDPIAALTENKDWSGRQIARQDFSKLNPTPGYTRAKDTASSLSRGLAYAFNYLSGGGEYGIGIVSPTPDQIDYLLGQLTGGVGRELGKVLTTGEAMATGEDLPPHKIPLVGRFYGDTTGQSSEASKFYGTLEKLSEHRGTLDRMKDARDAEAYREYAKEHPESRLYARAARVQRELASLRKLKRKMIERNADRAKVRQIEDRMRTLMTRFNQSVSEQKGDH